MKRPATSTCRRLPSGYTLIEILVATTLSLLLLGAVVAMFGSVGGALPTPARCSKRPTGCGWPRSGCNMDLAGVTVTMNPPRDPANNEGYFEYIEGPVGTSRQ